ncbi:hypothetical protein NDU88_011664 [Pleurodeles waltl]|uniref:Uncharacterized protein n=1 Tax=Pleurodeles waltl TaxID=8319 RepID=A0AAV7QXX0_PLEWA|nr:hypothetical protein NDU88_011664 [Pleurodeles waltl]
MATGFLVNTVKELEIGLCPTGQESVPEKPHCDGLAGTDPCTELTCAAAACGIPELHGANTNEKHSFSMTSGLPAGTKNEGRVKKSAFGTRREDNKEVEREEEEEKGDEALVGKEKRGTSNAERGEWLLPSRGEEDEEAADGGQESVPEKAHCDGLAGTDPCTELTCAAAACGIPELHGANTNEKHSFSITSGLPAGTKNKGRVKKSAFGTRREDNKEVEREEEEEKGDEALVGKEKRGTCNAERGEWLLPSWGEEDEEAADGEERERQEETQESYWQEGKVKRRPRDKERADTKKGQRQQEERKSVRRVEPRGR